MAKERPYGSPLHGKRVYAYLGQTGGTGGLNYVSFATEFSLSLTPQNTARAVVMGSDAVPDVEIHGLVARVRLNLLLTSTESDFLLALGGIGLDEAVEGQEVDFDLAVQELLSRDSFTTANRLNVVIAPLENSPKRTEVDAPLVDLQEFRNQAGYVIELNSAAITALEITGRTGEYTEARLEIESGRFRINAVETDA